MKTKTLILLTAGLTLSLGFAAYARTWTQAATGKTIEGDFVRLKDPQTAIISINGQQKNVPLAMLSKEDQDFIAEQVKAGPGGTAKAEPALPEGETTVVLSGVHLCCGGCKTAAKDALTKVADVVPTVGDKDITVKAPTGAKVKEALAELAKAGFYGKSDHQVLIIPEYAASDDAEVESVTLSDVHLCCRSCVDAVDKAIKTIDGATHTATTDATEFEVKGKFKKSAILAALHAEGLHATVK